MSNDILVPLDGSPLSETCVPYAVTLARRLGCGLHLMRVHTPMVLGLILDAPAFVMDPDLEHELEREARTWLTSRASEIRSTTGIPVTSALRVGTPADEIIAVAAERQARLIVCTTHGAGGWAPHWLGSVVDDVLRHASCPVLAIPETGAARAPAPASVLVLLDGSSVSAAILPAVKWYAKAFEARVELLHVVEPPWAGDAYNVWLKPDTDPFDIGTFAESAKRDLDTVAADLRADGLVVTTVVEVHLKPARSILDHIKRANPDVVALATHGRGISRLFLGSVADKVLRASARPTLCFCPPRAAAIPTVRVRPEALSELAGAGRAV
ncbi:MAG: universal stress protein [Gemmatimonadales bacterium]